MIFDLKMRRNRGWTEKLTDKPKGSKFGISE